MSSSSSSLASNISNLNSTSFFASAATDISTVDVSYSNTTNIKQSQLNNPGVDKFSGVANSISQQAGGKDREGYGLKLCGERVAVTYRKAKLDEDALAYIMSAKIFNCAERDLVKLGFLPCVDHHRLPKHKYYEGYFHGLETNESIPSINPRFQSVMPKPAAPIQLRAFAASFRHLNATWIYQAVKHNDHLKALWDKDYIFADFAIQVHFGDEVTGTNLHWHRDAYNSILHLALGLHGSRALHTKESTMPDETAVEVVDWQEIGSAYVSSPFAFMHAVEYAKCSWENRIIAIQLRILLDPKKKGDDDKISQEILKKAPEIMTEVSQALRSADLKIPTLANMKEMASRLTE